MMHMKITNEIFKNLIFLGVILLLGSCKQPVTNHDKSIDYDIEQYLIAKTENIPLSIKNEIAAANHYDDLKKTSIESQKWMHDSFANIDNPQLAERLIAEHDIDGGTMLCLMMECLRKLLRGEEIDSATIMKNIYKPESTD